MDQERPEPTGRRRRVPAPECPSFPRGSELVAELRAIARRHPLSEADKAYIVANVSRWRLAVLGEPGPTPTEDAGAADAPPGDPTGRTP